LDFVRQLYSHLLIFLDFLHRIPDLFIALLDILSYFLHVGLHSLYLQFDILEALLCLIELLLGFFQLLL